VFAKYRVDGGAWEHATLAGTGHDVPAGASLSVPSDRAGAFIYRSSSGYGTFTANGVGLRWDYAADGVLADASVEVRPFGIEMVFVPQGSFALGSGASRFEFRAGGTVSSPFVVSDQLSISFGDSEGQLTWSPAGLSGSPSGSTNASFPTGFASFYLMKRELTQGQYVDFLNTLTQAQADARKHTDDQFRYAITGTSVGTYATVLPFVAMNFVSWPDGAAFADWAGLRPMTELEFEKAARGPKSPLANEYAWGSTSSTAPTGLLNEGSATETPTPADANANFSASDDAIRGPVRAGSFALPGDSRRDAGAGFYGGLDLSGNVAEAAVTVGNAEGRAFAGTHGDGVLAVDGNANTPTWPTIQGIGGGGGGARGGGWNLDGTLALGVSARSLAAFTINYRDAVFGWRGVRSAP
jgi:formylglycine-generating enzyme required for sulfatase activity